MAARVAPLAIFGVFLRLGLTAFGGPIAHLAYFREAFVARRRWLTDAEYAAIVALAQFLPGPSSSQTGFAIGLARGGLAGGLAAFLGFTAPSAALMIGAAYLLGRTGGALDALVHGLQLVAVAVVAHAVFAMQRTLAPDTPRRLIALGAFGLLLAAPSAAAQLGVIAGGAVLGALLLAGLTTPRGAATPLVALPRGTAIVATLLLVASAAALTIAAATPSGVLLQAVAGVARAGALVFGGGHVILPLLEQVVVAPGWLTQREFLAGYGIAQALPGPINAFAAFVGAQLPGAAGGIVGALACLVAAFAPGLLLVLAVLPVWHRLAAKPRMAGAIVGANAAVVGLLGAALIDPIMTSAIAGPLDAAIAAAGFLALVLLRAPVLLVAVAVAAAGALQ